MGGAASMTRTQPTQTSGETELIVMTGATEGDLYSALRGEISIEPTPVSTVVEHVLRACRVDREEVVAAMWDLVEDEGFIYDAAARIRRRV